MDKNNSWKQKSAALTLAVSMIMVNPIALSGCNSSNNAQIKNSASQNQNIAKDKDEEEEEQQGSYSGGGISHSSSPFRFGSSSTSSSKNSTVSSQSSTGWHAWTIPSSSGGYSGVHASSSAS